MFGLSFELDFYLVISSVVSIHYAWVGIDLALWFILGSFVGTCRIADGTRVLKQEGNIMFRQNVNNHFWGKKNSSSSSGKSSS